MSAKDPSMEIRRPRPRTLDEFVGADEGAVATTTTPRLAAVPRPVDVPAAPPRKARGVAARAKGEPMGRLTVYIPLDVATKLRRYCFEQGIELTGECSRAIAEHVGRLKL